MVKYEVSFEMKMSGSIIVDADGEREAEYIVKGYDYVDLVEKSKEPEIEIDDVYAIKEGNG